MKIRLASISATAVVLGTILMGSAPQGFAAERPSGGVPEAAIVTRAGVVAAYSLATPVSATESGLVARAVVPMGVACPRLRTTHADGKVRFTAMPERVAPATTMSAFAPLRACSAPIPPGASSASVGGHAIPSSMPENTNRIAVFGDTGCRLKGSTIQACNDPTSWPLSQLSRSVALEKPQLIIFTGDFFYREAACLPQDTSMCAGSPAPGFGLPFKDTAIAWQADVFTPMASVLSAAPIVVVRGNHEACNRGGNGYFIYFDPREGTEGSCAPQAAADGSLSIPPDTVTGSYAVDVDVPGKSDLRLAIVDSAYGFDCEVSPIVPQQTAAYQAARNLAAQADKSWLLVHRPVAAWQVADDCAPAGGWISSDQQVSSYGLLDEYSLMVSSHIHLVQTMNLPGIPPQVVLGNGGTLLEKDTPFILPTTGPSFGTSPGYAAPTSGWWDVRFGYAMVRAGRNGTWLWQMKAPDSTVFQNCLLSGGDMDCKAPR